MFWLNVFSICVKFHVRFSLQCRYVHFFFHFSYADSEAYNTVESENFFDAEAGVYLQLPNDGLNFDEDSDAEEGNDPQHFSSPTYCKS